MRRSLLILLLALVPAEAAGAAVYPIPVPKHPTRYQVGIGEQSPVMFGDRAYKPLGLKRVRYIVPWDWGRKRYKRDEIKAYMRAARGAKAAVLVHFSAALNCYDGKRYSRARRCRAPKLRAYARSVRRFHKTFPRVRAFGVWNEANHRSQPVYSKPRRVGRYYNALRRICRRCAIVGADLLDRPSLVHYAQAFKQVARRSRLWGLHNYSDVNRRHTTATRTLLRIARGRVWLTETGGIVRFPPLFPYSLKRARSRTAYMFDLADRLSRRVRGYRSRITRIYPYAWRGEARGAHFDAGLVGPTGRPRPAYRVFRRKLATRSR